MAGDGVEVHILGNPYTIRGEADEDYIRGLADYVDDKMKVARSRNPTAPQLETAVMVAVNIADELFREREDHEQRGRMFEERMEELFDIVRS